MAAGGEVSGKLRKEPAGHLPSVHPPVEGEVHPRIRVPLLGSGGEVRRVEGDHVNASEPFQEVRSDRIQRKAPGVSLLPHALNGKGVPVGGHHPGAGPGRGEGSEPRTAPHLHEPLPRSNVHRPGEEEGILPDRVDVRAGSQTQ